MKTILTTLIASLCFVSVGSARADSICAGTETTFGVHGGTYHFKRDLQFEEFNPGAYVRFCGGITAGVYRNSYGDTSAYGGYTFTVGPVDITVGIISGYQNGLMPLLIPSVKLPFGGLRLAFIPPVPNLKNNSAGLHLMKDF